MGHRDYSLAETLDLAAELRLRWERDGVSFRAAATETEIAAFEQAHALRLPDDVLAYLSVVNGMTDRQWDGELLEFLSLGRMTEELARESNDPGYVVLVDYSLSSQVFGTRVCLEPAELAPIYSVGEFAEREVFPSFTELLRVHLRDQRGIVGR